MAPLSRDAFGEAGALKWFDNGPFHLSFDNINMDMEYFTFVSEVEKEMQGSSQLSEL